MATRSAARTSCTSANTWRTLAPRLRNTRRCARANDGRLPAPLEVGRNRESERNPSLVIKVAQLFFGLLELRPPPSRELVARAIDVERKHRQRRAKGIRLAPRAVIGGALERARDRA